MKKKIIVTGIIISIVHFVLAMVLIMVALGSTMEAFDNPDSQPPVIGNLAGWMVRILMQPVRSLWTSWMSKNMPDVVEWIFCMGNSLLWGFIIALLINVRSLATKKKTGNKSI